MRADSYAFIGNRAAAEAWLNGFTWPKPDPRHMARAVEYWDRALRFGMVCC